MATSVDEQGKMDWLAPLAVCVAPVARHL
jgi:hypothetical protein